MHHSGQQELPTVCPGMPGCEETLMAITLTMKKQANNSILMCYYMIGAHITKNNERFNCHKPIHHTAEFLYNYFLEDHPAIHLLENISHSSIIELPKNE